MENPVSRIFARVAWSLILPAILGVVVGGGIIVAFYIAIMVESDTLRLPSNIWFYLRIVTLSMFFISLALGAIALLVSAVNFLRAHYKNKEKALARGMAWLTWGWGMVSLFAWGILVFIAYFIVVVDIFQ